MKPFHPILFLTSLFLCLRALSYAEASPSPSQKEEAKEQTPEKKKEFDMKLLSESLGHMIGKNISSLDANLEIDCIVEGIKNGFAGKEARMSESECLQAFSMIQDEAFKAEAMKNLEEANVFMEKNGQEDGVVQIEKNKLHYKIEKEGKGQVVENHFSPLIRYMGHFLDGKVFNESKEGYRIPLDESVSGLRKGIIGMKEGEKRTLFIHPDEGYGINGSNALLVFEVEVLQANAPAKEELDSPIPPISEETEEKSETPIEEPKAAVR